MNITKLRVIAGVSTAIEAEELSLPLPRHRPGEHREAFRLATSTAGTRFVRRARELGLDVELAYMLALEQSLLLDDAERSGYSRVAAAATLDGAAARPEADGELGGAASCYLRALMDSRAGSEVTSTGMPELVAVPMRFYMRATELDTEAVERADLKQAKRWEVASLIARRTMTEWGLCVLLESDQAGRRQR